jgi:hypothetical protein
MFHRALPAAQADDLIAAGVSGYYLGRRSV